jgi:predicted RNase H-like nuclease (RuvC/YqgF family)
MTPREKSFSTFKTQVACLESDVVQFKQDITKSMEEIIEYIQKKDNDLMMQEKIEKSELNAKLMKQSISDLTLKQYEQEEEIGKLRHTIKNQQHEIQHLKTKLSTITEHQQ